GGVVSILEAWLMADLEHVSTEDSPSLDELRRTGDGEERVLKLRGEVEPPQGVTCRFCGCTETRFVYSTVYRESGFRRVNHQCQNVKCRAILWWDEKLKD